MPTAHLCLDCSAFCTGTRCDRCAARRKGERTAAYDREHQALREQLVAAAADAAHAGRPWLCPRCHRPMLAGQPLDLGHDVDVIDGGARGARQLEHRACNRRAGSIRGHQLGRGGGGRS